MSRSVDSTARNGTTGLRSRLLMTATVLGLATAGMFRFGWDLKAEPQFADEWAYYAQSFYGPLWWEGRWNEPAWFDLAAIDLPPLPKYAIAASLVLDGKRLPPREASDSWYANINRRFGTIDDLSIARRPSVIFGVLGVVATYSIGLTAADGRVGLLAALLLTANPLYATLARRAMSDVPTEALSLSCLAVGLASWRAILSGRSGASSWTGWSLGAGALSGLAILSKLSGGLGLMTLAAWATLALIVPRFGWLRRLGLVTATVVAGAVGYLVFVAGNPVLVSRPELPARASEGAKQLATEGLLGRTRLLVDHRLAVGRDQSIGFAEYALNGPLEKAKVVAAQGFGRFGPFGPRPTDSTQRYDLKQDWGAVVWLPLVTGGLVVLASRGHSERRAGLPPLSWALAVQFAVALATVGAFLPLAWDRYHIALQPVSALLAAVAVMAAWDRVVGRAAAKPIRMEASADPAYSS